MDALETLTADDDRKQISELDDEAVFTRLKQEFSEDDEHNREWRERVPGRFRFVKGGKHQWDDDALAKMEGTNRVPVAFNRVNPIIKAVSGVEINTRTQASFFPREPDNEEEVAANEVLSAANDWMGDGCRAHRAQSQAFLNAFICGAGVTEAVVDFKERRDGKYLERRCNPAEFRWDCDAREPNLVDATRFHRVRRVKLHAAAKMFKNMPSEALDASWAHDLLPGEKRDAEGKTASKTAKGMVTLVHSQWMDDEPYYLIEASVPMLGGLDDLHAQAFAQLAQMLDGETEFTAEEFGKYKALLDRFAIPFQHIEMAKRCVKQAILGFDRLLKPVEEAPCKTAFNWNFVTYDVDYDGLPYGAVDLMEDPQRYANKWLSQTLHILNSTAKGGIIAESDAFDDIDEAEKTYAKADAITFVRPGSLGKGKIMAKPGAGLSAPYLQLSEFAIAAIRDSVGVSLELLGMRDATQPGILEHQRKQAGLTILAPLFDAHKEFKERNAVVRLYYLQTHFSDGRLIRVTGEDGVKKGIRLIKDKVMGDYDTEIDEVPTSPNQKEQNWVIISQVLPLFRDALEAEEMVEILEYSPLPSRLVTMFKRKLQQPPSPEEVEAQQLLMAEKRADIAGKAAKAKRDDTAAWRDRIAGVLDIVDKAIMANQAKMEEAQRVAAAQPPASMTPDQILRQLALMQPDPMPMQQGGPALPGQPPALPMFGAQPQQAAVEPPIAVETNPGGLNGQGL